MSQVLVNKNGFPILNETFQKVTRKSDEQIREEAYRKLHGMRRFHYEETFAEEIMKDVRFELNQAR